MARKVDGFRVHGVDFHSERDNQLIGDCPFCSRENKFYVNAGNLLWDCKVCHASGNYLGFLQHVAERNAEQITDRQKDRLAENRGIPWDVFEAWGVGYGEGVYTIPVYDERGRLCDLRRYTLGGRVMASPGCSTGLLGAHAVPDADVVMLCEGEWDLFAACWMLREAGESIAVCAVPGAGVFKAHWDLLFEGKQLITAYDLDAPGEAGEKKVWDRLHPIARSVRCVRWKDDMPDGYDVRDFVTFRARRIGKAWSQLERLFKPYPRAGGAEELRAAGEVIAGEEPTDIPPDVGIATFRRWLLLPNDDVIDAVFGAIFANLIDWKNPLWLYLIGASGGGKSAILSSLWGAPRIYSVSSLTPRALASGAVGPGGRDPSLIPRLNHKILVAKDFAAILGLNPQDQKTIFNDLRDAYDGKFSKEFGVGVKRTFESSFGLIAGCTPTIDGVIKDEGLGERFVKYRIPTLERVSRRSTMEKAILSSFSGEQMSTELQSAAAGMISFSGRSETPPELTPSQLQRIIDIAEWVGYMRGIVLRDPYSREVLCRMTREEPTRIGIQLAKYARGIAWFRCLDKVDARAMRIIEYVARCTPKDRDTDIVEALAQAALNGHAGRGLTERELGVQVRLPQSTVNRRLHDLTLLDVVQKRDRTWVLHDDAQEMFPGWSA